MRKMISAIVLAVLVTAAINLPRYALADDANALIAKATTAYTKAQTLDGEAAVSELRSAESALLDLITRHPDNAITRSLVIGNGINIFGGGQLSLAAIQEKICLVVPGVDCPLNSRWQVQDTPTKVLRAGESFGPISMLPDASVTLGNGEVFPAAPDPEGTQGYVFEAPVGDHAVLVQFDENGGGLRAVVVNTRDGKVINADIIPPERVRYEADANAVLQVLPTVSWAPDGRYVAIPVSATEWTSAPAFVNLETGGVLKPEPFGQAEDKGFAMIDMASLYTDRNEQFWFDWKIYQCANEVCEDPEYVDAVQADPVSVSENIAQTSVVTQVPIGDGSGDLFNVTEFALDEYCIQGGKGYCSRTFGRPACMDECEYKGVDDTYAFTKVDKSSVDPSDAQSISQFFNTQSNPVFVPATPDNIDPAKISLAYNVRRSACAPGVCPEAVVLVEDYSTAFFLEVAAKVRPAPVVVTRESSAQMPVDGYSKLMAARYSQECSDFKAGADGVSCPSAQRDCIGGLCITEGAARLLRQVSVVAKPGSEEVIATVPAGDYLAFTDVLTYGVPCRAFVTRDNYVDLLDRAKWAYRLNPAGEGVWSYITDLGTVWSAVGDEIGIAEECPVRNESWYQVTTAQGASGWAMLTYEDAEGLGGYFNLSGALPEWVRDALPVTFRSIDFDGKFCKSGSPPLTAQQLSEFMTGLRGLGTVGARNHRPKYSLYFSGKKAKQFKFFRLDLATKHLAGGKSQSWEAGRYYLDGNKLCLSYDGLEEARCFQISACTGNDYGKFSSTALDGERQFAFSEIWYNAPAAEQRYGQPRNLSTDAVIPAMAGVDPEIFRNCRIANLDLCLKQTELTPEVREGYRRLFLEYQDIVVVEKFRELGWVDYAEFFLPHRANSNSQDAVVNQISYEDSPRDNIDKLLEKRSFQDAAPLKARYPNTFVDTGRSRLIYFRRQDSERVSFYRKYDIVNGCRACEIVGEVVVRSDYYKNILQRIEPVMLSADIPAPSYVNDAKIDFLRLYQNVPRMLQKDLKAIGFYKGPIDGIIGSGTVNALRDFQFMHCLDVTGMMDIRTAEALGDPASLWGACYEG